MKAERLFTAVDIGTVKVCALAAEMTEKGPRVLASAMVPSRGIKKGAVVSRDEAAASVRSAVHEVQTASGRKIPKAVVGISGQHVSGIPGTGVIGIRGREITPDDRIRAVDSAKATYMPLDREVLHVIPTEFVLDGEQGITDPVGMSGVRLESRVYIVTAQAQAVQDLEQSCRTAGLEVLAMVFSPAATALAILTRDEVVRGAVLIDIGGGTTDIAVFRNGALVHAAVVGIGGLHLTNDLAVCLNVDVADAERLKITAGAACRETGHGSIHAGSSLPADAARAISKSHLVSVIQPRCEELCELVRQEMRRACPQGPYPRSAVLTGGTAYLDNMSGLAASILGIPARLGMPQGKFGVQGSLRNPACAAAIGLLSYAFEHSVLDRMSALPGGVIGNMKKRVTDLTGYKDFLEMLQKKKKGVSYV